MRRQRILILAGGAIGLVLLMALGLLFRPDKKSTVPGPIVTTDPVTGDKLIETPGVDPETGGVEHKGIPLLGGQKLYDYLDDDYTFSLLKDNIFFRYFKEKTGGKAKLIKLVPSSFTTKTIGGGTSGNAQKTTSFTLVTDLNDDPYQVSVIYRPVEGELVVDIKDKAGVVSNYKDFTKLVD